MIFYYSGTGNSKYAAEKLLPVTGGELHSMSDCVKNNTYEFRLAEGELLGFVFPVYCYTVPMTVREFVKKLDISGGKDIYSYAVATCGESTGRSCRLFAKLYPVTSLFGLPMVDNYLPFQTSAPNDGEISEFLDNADNILNEIIGHISARDTGNLNRFEGKSSAVVSKIADNAYVKGRATSDFSISDGCVGCGICESICPCSAIKVTDGKAAFVTDKCDQCFGCVHRCPVNAIDFKKSAAGKGQYVNPRTKL